MCEINRVREMGETKGMLKMWGMLGIWDAREYEEYGRCRQGRQTRQNSGRVAEGQPGFALICNL